MAGPWSIQAGANDSIAHLSAGGLVLSRTDEIRIASEDLAISRDGIEVSYRFANLTGRAVTTLVAFPLPDVRHRSEADNFMLPGQNSTGGGFPFETIVDGKPVSMDVQHRAIAAAVDRTDMLIDMGLPVDPNTADLAERIGTLPASARKTLREAGMIDDRWLESGLPGGTQAVPLWAVRSTYFWTQTFPADRELVVRHRYRPSVGSMMLDTIPLAESRFAEWKMRYCAGREFIAAARNILAKRQHGLVAYTVGYVLQTGANWGGPISSFNLTVDKGSPQTLVTFCLGGPRSGSGQSISMSLQDFRPEADLEILFIEPVPLH